MKTPTVAARLRAVLTVLALGACTGSPGTSSMGAAPAPGPRVPTAFTVDTLAPGLYRVPAPPDGTVLLWTGPGGPVQVDALTPARAASLDTLVWALAGRPPAAVVNTHYHEDHRGMNALAAASGATVVAHPEAVRLMQVDTTIVELDWHRPAAPEAALPGLAVADSLLLAGGAVRVLALAPAHTSGDVIVHFPAEDVVHTGDVLELGAFPFIDRWAGGTVVGTLAAVDRLLARTGPRTRFVPGHGPVADRARVVAYREMLAGVLERVRAAVAAGGAPEDVLADPWVAGLAPAWGSANQLRFLVGSVWAEVAAAGA